MIDYLRELNFVSVALRLLLSAVIGFSLGMERGRKRRPAGCRTYMLVCMGATLTLLLSQYEYYMLTNRWYDLALEIGIRTVTETSVTSRRPSNQGSITRSPPPQNSSTV